MDAENDHQDVRPPALRQQIDGALPQPGRDQHGAEEVPESKDQRIPAEHAIIGLTKSADAVHGHADAPEQKVRPPARAVALEDEEGENKANNTGGKGQ
jgi:hypothetical protein